MSEMIQALKDSIKHWENLRDGNDYRVGPKHCALCTVFSKDVCIGCPIHYKTGEGGCVGTPYYDYTKNPTDENAQKEVDFLKDILIEELERLGKVFTAEEKKPKRCCDSFEQAVTEGDIRKSVEYSFFTFGNYWVMTYCPFCATRKKNVLK